MNKRKQKLKINPGQDQTFERLRTLDAYRASRRSTDEKYDIDLVLSTGTPYLVAKNNQTFGIAVPVGAAWLAEFDRQTDRMELKIVALSVFSKDGSNYLEITLTDERLLRTFGDFVDNLIEELQADRKADPGAVCIRLLSDSQRLFRAAGTKVPGEEAQVGLLLELETLAALSISNGSSVLRRWTGPEGNRHDFELEDISIECKATLSQENLSIKIHGARQLATTGDKPLVLVVRRYERTIDGGISVPDVIREISTLGVIDTEDFARRLGEVGISHEVLEKADEFARFESLETYEFEVSLDFPQIQVTALHDRIIHVAYTIDLRDPSTIAGFRPAPLILKGN